MRMHDPNNKQSDKTMKGEIYNEHLKYELIGAQHTTPQWVIQLQLPLIRTNDEVCSRSKLSGPTTSDLDGHQST